MNTMIEAVDQYIEMRRTLGYKMAVEHSKLRNFAKFMEKRNAPYITQQIALEWAQLPGSIKSASKANRLATVRSFACYRQSEDARTEIPAQGLVCQKRNRPTPYLYTDEQINALLSAARNLPHRYQQGALTPWTYWCLFGLLSVTGMRLGEACSLEIEDVNLAEATLTVRHAKHGRSRVVPVHESVCERLAQYANRREQHWKGRAKSNYFFVLSRGTKIDRHPVDITFRSLTC